MVLVPVLALILGMFLALWVRRVWLTIPPGERASWPEIKKGLGGFWPAVRATWRELVQHIARERAVTRRMNQDARRARRELIVSRREEVRREIRKVGRL